MTKTLNINNREFPNIPKKTYIVVCLDGSQKEYLETYPIIVYNRA